MNRLFLFLSLLAPVSVFSQPVNVQLSTTVFRNTEPMIAINPSNTQQVVAAWMSIHLLTMAIATRTSSDGGATWNDTTHYLPHNGNLWESADVTLTWGKNGTLYLCYVDFIPNSNTQGGDFVVHSTDGGTTWSAPVEAIAASADSDLSLDRPWLVVDNSEASTSGYLYLCTKPAPWNPLPNHSYFTRSTDGGQHWEPDHPLDTGNYSASLIGAPMGSPTVASDGTLYIAYPYLVLDSLSGGIALAVSHDGGGTFSRSFLMRPFIGTRNDSVKDAFRLISDPSNAQHLLFAWSDSRNGDYDIFAVTSFDAGQSWSNPKRINDDPIGNGVMQDMLWPTFQADGTAAIVWRDRRNGPPNGYASPSDTYAATSSDGGLTWSSNIRLTSATAPYDTVLYGPGNDFMSAALAHDSLYCVWADTRTDSLRVYFTKTFIGAQSGVATSPGNLLPMLSIAPNPGSESVTVTYWMPVAGKSSLLLYDERGVLVRTLMDGPISVGSHQAEYSVASLRNGDYFLELEMPSAMARAKLTIRR